MADILLKDKDGTDVKYENVNSVSFRTTTEGETATFIAQKQADWNQTDTTAVDYIKNKPQDLATKDFVESHVQEKIDAIEIPEDVANKEYVQKEINDAKGFVQDLIDNIDIPDTQVQADWNQTDISAKDFIKNRPFGLLVDILPEQSITFVADEEVDLFVSNDIHTSATFIAGETYRVIWDETVYELEARECSAISNIPDGLGGDLCWVGNSSMFGTIWEADFGDDTGEPFFALCEPNGLLRIATNDLVHETHIVGIAPINNKKKLDAEWLPDGLATEEYVKKEIAAIEIPEGGGSSGGGASNEKVFLEETEIENLFNLDGLIGAHIPFTDYLNIGETYYVNWNGVEYEVANVQDTTALMQNLIDPAFTRVTGMGNGEIFGLGGNNEPFIIITTGETLMFGDLSPEATIGGKNIVRIYQKTPLTVSWENVTDKPFGDDFIEVSEGEEIDLLVEQDISGFAEQNGLYVVQISPAIAPVVEGETYSIRWDGVLYSDLYCSIVNIGNVNYHVVGNIGLAGGDDTGEPFAIACVYVGDDAVNAFFSNNTLDTHKVGVFQKEPTVCTIKESYIPDSVKLPTATADDNNKFLRIVNGVPTWVTLTDVSVEGA